MVKCTVEVDLGSVSVILRVISFKLVVCEQTHFAVSWFNNRLKSLKGFATILAPALRGVTPSKNITG